MPSLSSANNCRFTLTWLMRFRASKPDAVTTAPVHAVADPVTVPSSHFLMRLPLASYTSALESNPVGLVLRIAVS